MIFFFISHIVFDLRYTKTRVSTLKGQDLSDGIYIRFTLYLCGTVDVWAYLKIEIEHGSMNRPTGYHYYVEISL